MQTIHLILAAVTVIAVAAALAWSVALAATGKRGGRAYERFLDAIVGLVLGASVAGALIFVSGTRPTDGLHVVYAGIAIVLLPLARSYLGPSSRRDRLLLLGALVVLGGVVFRLFATN